MSRLPSQFRLMLLSIGVGIVAGLGAILFDRLLGWTLHTVLQAFTGHAEPRAGSSAASLFTLAPVPIVIAEAMIFTNGTLFLIFPPFWWNASIMASVPCPSASGATR